ncbi:structural maintenance of chromosome 3 (chondroitin sulfate proteoglycan 6) [Angomonas deanei]|uniref:Structural maintenance of chromosomes protein n=1 Tax=Angomonas deanei TaxID=59799 RepID=A0A7G2CFT0_9TRYP|nr:structural maintenance of chromosome 3 (chondroitin sulfate proteoglycan 6) [Angomonas deanei]CAD2217012.1 RecF/RecN/SMC N terminal domain/AAA domain/SMC proteins Flexible Hinge Domain/AAA domain, putative AbiEii toxin, Type IV TA system, putative [Angomonas deanei]|eukprot:EPY33125.1 structural maintenance of chromosome 3 (chondroitin sulfate proteoglycan 6) [Angomonas deanei]
MHIKNIIISGFRSYREQSFPDGLSTGTNVIVGKNGSGKSNFFAAIQFVLSEKYTNLRALERKELFHVGSGRPSLSIFVEIVFDNSDGRLVIPGRADEAEVRIRRTVGLKQDEFRVNDRKFTAAEVHQLLESAGFSSSNPYYIVEQGKIISLVNVSEEERYQIIKDVAGTQVYESRRRESEKILEDTEGKRKQIVASIGELEKRLKELEGELTELKEFQEADREKRCIEYFIFSNELESTKESLRKLERERSSILSNLNVNQDSVLASENEISALSDKRSVLKQDLLRLADERKITEAEITELNNRQAIVDINAKDASGRETRNEREKKQLLRESEQLLAAAEKAKAECSSKTKNYAAVEKTASELFQTVESEQKRLQKLQEKRGRSKLFKSKEDRDKWINEEIKNNEIQIRKSKEEISNAEKEISDCDRNIKEEIKGGKSLENAGENYQKIKDAHDKKVKDAFEKRDILNQARRTMWQEIHAQEAVVKRLEEATVSAKRRLDNSCRQDIRQGLQSLREILTELKDERISSRVFGPLIDLITVEEGYEAAVEVTAGNTLFNVVVDSFDTSAFLLEQMNKRRKPGRISFFPMDTCKGVHREFNNTPESSSLLSKVKFEKKFGGVVSEVLGRTLVVSSLDVGAKLCKELSCDVVTTEGDQLGKKGAITGGYLDKRNMKLTAYRNEKDFRRKLEAEEAILTSLCQKVASKEQAITDVLNEIDELRNENISVENQTDLALREKRQKEDRIAHLQTLKENLQNLKKSHEKNISEAEATIKNLREEMKEDFKTAWTAENEKELELLLSVLSKKRAESATAQAKALQLATERQLAEDTVAHLERRRQIVEDRIKEIGWTNLDAETNREGEALKRDLAEATSRLSELISRIETVDKELANVEATLDSLNLKKVSSSANLQERKDVVDKTEVQRKLLSQRRDEAIEKIRKLSFVPNDSDKHYEKFSIGKLMHNLKQANEKRNKFSHINRKAVDQHGTLSETRSDLVAQKEALDKERKSIHELITHLDKQKDEAIERTYKQIQYQFEEVFKELVGVEDCVAELQLVKSNNESITGEAYVGARIRVSFGLGTAVSDLEQLSGGQKSLVALALIFSIQRCDPAPFYLFDEIDSALDAEYRTSVSKMIKKQSENCQFLIASFKTEMLTAADKILGIFFHNKVSRIQMISKDEGLKLLKQAAEEDRKRSRDTE